MFGRRKKTTRIGGRERDDEALPVERQPVVVAVPRPKWRWIPFLISHLLAIGLAATWLWPDTRRIWDLYDAGMFRMLNATLMAGDWWATAMAHANTRRYDIAAAVFIGGLLLWNIRFYEKRCIFSGWFSLGVFVSTVVLVKMLVCGTIVHDAFGYHRASPTNVVESCHRISQIAPQVAAKDSSPWSFPGDHGFVLFSVALYLVYRGNGRQETLAWLFVLLFGLPRMVVGAHWATDIVVGSAVVALLLTAWLMATPLHDKLVNGLCWRLAQTSAGLFNRQPAAA